MVTRCRIDTKKSSELYEKLSELCEELKIRVDVFESQKIVTITMLLSNRKVSKVAPM